MKELKIETVDLPNGAIVVSLAGSADVVGLPILERQLTSLLARKPTRVVFDLAGLTFIASLSIGALIHFRSGALGWGGKVQLACANDQISNTLKRVRVDVLLPVYPTIDAALAVS